MNEPLEKILGEALAKFNSETTTIHKLHQPTQLLRLVAQVGLPPSVLELVTIIPVGQGIAGECAQKNRPVVIGDLPDGGGSAVCVLIREGDKIVGTLSLGTQRQHEYSAAEINSLQDIANSVATHFA